MRLNLEHTACDVEDLLAFSGEHADRARVARVDVFAIWELILCAIGLKVVFGLKGSKSYALVFAVWAARRGIDAPQMAKLLRTAKSSSDGFCCAFP